SAAEPSLRACGQPVDNFAAHNHQIQALPCLAVFKKIAVLAKRDIVSGSDLSVVFRFCNANSLQQLAEPFPMVAFSWKCLTAIPLVLTGSGTINVTASAQGGNAEFSAPGEKMLAPRFVVPLSTALALVAA